MTPAANKTMMIVERTTKTTLVFLWNLVFSLTVLGQYRSPDSGTKEVKITSIRGTGELETAPDAIAAAADCPESKGDHGWGCDEEQRPNQIEKRAFFEKRDDVVDLVLARVVRNFFAVIGVSQVNGAVTVEVDILANELRQFGN